MGVIARVVDPNEEDLRYLDGPWDNASCKGYAMMALDKAGIGNEEAAKVLSAMEECFDEYTVREAARYYYNGGRL